MLGLVDHATYAGLAVASAAAGDARQAASALARLRGREFADVARSSSWLVAMYGAVETAHLLRDQRASAEAYSLLRPFARLPMMPSLAIASLGSTHHALGVASLTVGELDRAVAHFREAVRHNRALGHVPAAVLSTHRLGEALTLRNGNKDALQTAPIWSTPLRKQFRSAWSCRRSGGLEPLSAAGPAEHPPGGAPHGP
jgi:hypothetical protein